MTAVPVLAGIVTGANTVDLQIRAIQVLGEMKSNTGPAVDALKKAIEDAKQKNKVAEKGPSKYLKRGDLERLKQEKELAEKLKAKVACFHSGSSAPRRRAPISTSH